ncbi:MAG: hypothetical protein WAQ00_10985 [Tepidanaerobacteraceae bacterium]
MEIEPPQISKPQKEFSKMENIDNKTRLSEYLCANYFPLNALALSVNQQKYNQNAA